MYDFWLILHFLGLALAVGTGFSMMTLGMATADMAPPDRGAFMRRAFALSKNGSVGLLLLIVSGVGLILNRGVDVVMAWGGGFFHAKLTVIAILVGVFGYMQVQIRKAKSGDVAAMMRTAIIGRIMLLLGITIVILAVLAFH